MLSIVELKTRTITAESLAALAGRLIVSCQAPETDPFHAPDLMARFAQTAIAGGAAGIRANSPEDVRAIRNVTSAPIIGLQKRIYSDGRVLITPSFEDAVRLVEAGTDIIALDCTARGQKAGAFDRIRRIRAELGVPVLADIATVEEAQAAAAAGADIVASTMRGYTDETASITHFQPEFIAALVAAVDIPVLAEGRIQSPAEAARAIAAGAWAVIVGSAITRPENITAAFARQVERTAAHQKQPVLGIDIGGTNTKSAIVEPNGTLHAESVTPTPAGGCEALLAHLGAVVDRGLRKGMEIGAIGVATAGWVDPETGRVVWATANLPGWTGAAIANEIRVDVPVIIENDANAVAVAERRFGAGRGVDNFICLTLGTGVGGGCYVGGRLVRGAHSLGNALGHISIASDGPPCSCGKHGCLELYTNAAALVRYAGDSSASAEDIIRAAHTGDPRAAEAIHTLARHLATGLATIVHILDPQLVLISGGLAEKNALLFEHLKRELASRVMANERRRLQVRRSELGYYSGVLGAAAAALER
jgi:N-acetylmannosamine-6-phosphate 2-epimerase / N-acetylmannosamine kinase